jgi:hypothetical protein
MHRRDEPTDRVVQRGWAIPEDEIKSEMAKFIPECDNSEERERERRGSRRGGMRGERQRQRWRPQRVDASHWGMSFVDKKAD